MNLPGNPYPPRELLGAIWRMFGGAATPESAARAPGVQTIEYQTSAAPNRWIGFVGDILPLMWRKAEISPGIRDFFSECEWVVGNFEGIFTSKRWFPFLQKHTLNTFSALEQTAPAKKWCLSVANNHAGDYGEWDFLATVAEIERRGMRHFGSHRTRRIELADGITLGGWTHWQNRPSPWINLEDPGAPDQGLAIASPHWGYEYERQPRAALRSAPPRGYGLIVGHHPHFSQPIERLSDGRLVAWSLGNFLTEVKLASMGEGAILKVGLGPDQSIALARHAQIRLDRRDARLCRVHLLGEERA